MAVNPQAKIVVRHLSGSKINQVEQIPLKDLQEITIGRDPTSGIAYDQRRDDVVSRRHATIRIDNGEKLALRLVDLGSSNGTLLNGERVTGEVELALDDTVELGRGGPKFTLDVQPRPENMAARTRVMTAMDATATRTLATAGAAVTGTADLANGKGTKEIGTAAGTRESAPPAKPSVGKDTILHMLFQERQKSSKIWMSSIAAVLAVLVVSGAGLFYYQRVVSNQIRQDAAEDVNKARADASAVVAQQLGASSKAIANKYGNSSVVVNLGWRMYDTTTGKPLYHKVVPDPTKKTGNLYPAFVKLPNGDVVRWLTTDDGERRNIAVKSAGAGSGFVVSETGFILTNKHVAAGWMLPYKNFGQNINDVGLVFAWNGKKYDIVNLGARAIQETGSWVPEDGGLLFEANTPTLLGGSLGGGTPDDRRAFQGRNDLLEVRFPGNRVSMQATLVRASTDADAALIKVESAQSLRPVELAPEDDKVEMGDKVIVLGFPAVSSDTIVKTPSVEPGQIGRGRIEFVPEPTVTEGIISQVGAGLKQDGGMTVSGSRGDTYQMSVNATGAGNSGGPVFNAKGQVIGLFTYSSGDGKVSFAVPIKHGRALLNPQRSSSN